ncbi:mast cell protease 8-like [Plodia interpunctella]|uniref:mast cell protease 8-like n=1 Tax=Plodia interpunctella TaxID=58824 RepID=UPI0023686032|nr:mast cell protease 8-like [Plodia interpunctella]
MKSPLDIIYVFATIKLVNSNLDGYITGGSFARYSQYPHAVYLDMRCDQRFVCGGSVLTQDVILTAAHCMEGCEGVKHEDVLIKYGHEDIRKMKNTYLRSFVQHEHYDEYKVVNDICLLATKKRIPLNKVVKRVILMKHPPHAQYGYIAGWGNDEYGNSKTALKHTDAKIQNLNVCKNMGWLPKGTFCAGPITGLGAANEGDSGGALVIENYVQIGLVSFKVDKYSLVAYTNITHFLGWIRKNSKRLYCNTRKENKNK